MKLYSKRKAVAYTCALADALGKQIKEQVSTGDPLVERIFLNSSKPWGYQDVKWFVVQEIREFF